MEQLKDFTMKEETTAVVATIICGGLLVYNYYSSIINSNTHTSGDISNNLPKENTETTLAKPNSKPIGSWQLNIKKEGYMKVHTKYSSKSCQCYVEVSLSDFQSAENAYLGGANSIELCSDRHDGGTTPSYGLIKAVVQRYKYTDVSNHLYTY